MLTSTSFQLAFAFALLNNVASEPAAFTPIFTPVAFPAPQVSVTSTAFNPAIQNPGGTTNSAGTFNVVSLSQSTSVAYDSNIPITTSFVISPAPFAASQQGIIPSYYTPAPSATGPFENPASTASVSLATTVPGVSPVSALTTVAGDGAMINVNVNGAWSLLLPACAAVAGALFVL